ncbi:mitochondrial ribosomal protein L11 [Cladochytrium replicatum]|nr:mitochondrial ribosomal protein L11 [Cladochytrium replicatum]
MAAPQSHTIRIRVQAGKASPSPPIGPALVQVIKVNADKSYKYTISSPPTSYLILRAAGIEKGAAKPGSETVGMLSLKHVYELAKIKHGDPTMQHMPLRSVAAEILGQARSIGVKIVQ